LHSESTFFAGLTDSAVEAPKLAKFRQVNDNDSVLVTDLQATTYVFGSNCAFYLRAQCLTVCPLAGSFIRRTVSALQGLQFTHPICPTTFSVDSTF